MHLSVNWHFHLISTSEIVNINLVTLILEKIGRVRSHYEIYYRKKKITPILKISTWVIFKKIKTLCDIEGEISNWTN